MTHQFNEIVGPIPIPDAPGQAPWDLSAGETKVLYRCCTRAMRRLAKGGRTRERRILKASQFRWFADDRDAALRPLTAAGLGFGSVPMSTRSSSDGAEIPGEFSEHLPLPKAA